MAPLQHSRRASYASPTYAGAMQHGRLTSYASFILDSRRDFCAYDTREFALLESFAVGNFKTKLYLSARRRQNTTSCQFESRTASFTEYSCESSTQCQTRLSFKIKTAEMESGSPSLHSLLSWWPRFFVSQ